MDNILVTIGIPVYNVEAYIEKCLLSVLDQTYANLEVLAIDDCGTDNSIEMVMQIQQTHARGKCVKIIKQSHNRGLSEARNAAIFNAKGKYLYFIDSDDYIERQTIEIMVAQAEKHSADIVMGSFRCYHPEDGSMTKGFEYPSMQVFNGPEEFASLVCKDLHEHVGTCVWNNLFRVEFLRLHHLFLEGRNSEEFLFLSKYYSFVERAVLMPDITYYYVIREDSLMGRHKREKIPVWEIRERFSTDRKMTLWCSHIKDKPFYGTHCARVMKHKFRAVCVALRHRKRFTEWLTDDEIRQELAHPVSFSEICGFNRYRIFNLFFYFLGKLPSSVSVKLSHVIGRCLRWI